MINKGSLRYFPSHEDIDLYFKLLDGYQTIRSALMDSDKIEREIRESKLKNERLELERKKSFLNDILEIAKFITKVSVPSLLASIALPGDLFSMKTALLWLCTAGLVFGIAMIATCLSLRADAEEKYIEQSKGLMPPYDDQLRSLVDFTDSVKEEVAILNELVRIQSEKISIGKNNDN